MSLHKLLYTTTSQRNIASCIFKIPFTIQIDTSSNIGFRLRGNNHGGGADKIMHHRQYNDDGSAAAGIS
jgi:hypothetical protein